jgi:methionyl-tRNA synthetase
VKNPEEKQRLETVLFYSLEACRIAGILLQPVMPTKMENLLNRLGVSKEDRYFKNAGKLIDSERPLGEAEGVIFPKLK